MLTGNLVRVRSKGDAIAPAYLRGDRAERVRPLADALVSCIQGSRGRSRDEITQAFDGIELPARDRIVGLGLRKLLEDRCDFEVKGDVDAIGLRRDLFVLSARHHRELGVRDRFDRDAVLVALGEERATDPTQLEAMMYADLRGNEVLASFRPIHPDALVDRYNVALAQAILLRATQVTIRVKDESPARYKRLFRAIRFHELLHVVRGNPRDGYTIDLDGPFSLWGPVQRYGLRLALFLPTLLRCRNWQLRAHVRWGKERREALFHLDPTDGLVADSCDDASDVPPDLRSFCAAFEKLGSSWRVKLNSRIFALPGEVACIPDLVFESDETGEEVYLERFGFWSRDAVWKRIELLRKGFPARVILAVGKQLRVSETVLDENDTGEIYVYRTAMSPRALLARLDSTRAS